MRLRPSEGKEKADLPSYEYGSFVIQNEVMASEAIIPTLEVTNPGTVIGGESLSLYIDGEEADTRFVRVSSENEEPVDFAFKPGKPGTYEVAVDLSPDDLIATETVEVTPARTNLESGASSEITLEYTFDMPGEYAVAIEDLGPWTVTVPEPEAA